MTGRGYYSDRRIKERRDAAKRCICPSYASNRGECPIHDEKGRVRMGGRRSSVFELEIEKREEPMRRQVLALARRCHWFSGVSLRWLR